MAKTGGNSDCYGYFPSVSEIISSLASYIPPIPEDVTERGRIGPKVEKEYIFGIISRRDEFHEIYEYADHSRLLPDWKLAFLKDEYMEETRCGICDSILTRCFVPLGEIE